MPNPPLLQALNQRFLIMDGAMGTELQRLGISKNECYELWNLTHPDSIREIHRRYREAGAEVLLTHTFQANRKSLSQPSGRSKDADPLQEVWLAAVNHARSAGVWILADIGPFEEAPDSFDSVVEVFKKTDGILLETFSDPRQVDRFRQWKQNQLGDSFPLFASFSFRKFNGTLQTYQGFSPEECVALTKEIQGVGINCGTDLGETEWLNLIERFRAVTSLPIFVRPNAGTPQWIDGKAVYPRSVLEWSQWGPGFRNLGINMMGGCCGTTPEYIEGLAKEMNQ